MTTSASKNRSGKPVGAFRSIRWGDLISADFYTKADAIEYAKDVSKFGVDWDDIYQPKNYAKSALYRRALSQLAALRDKYEAGGFFKP
jgi:hypothetical protein